jgi:hypothetical protein
LGFFSPSGFDSVLKASEHIHFDLAMRPTVVIELFVAESRSRSVSCRQLISLGKTTSAAIRARLSSTSFDERSCVKPTADEFLRIVQNIDEPISSTTRVEQ